MKGRKPFKAPARQRGVVLIIALIVLVAMFLAGVALVRSVDTTVIVAGNIALKQSAIQGSDAGTQTAITWLQNNSSGVTLQNTDQGNGYISNYPLIQPPGYWFDATNWADAVQLNGGAADAAGNVISYIIHRLCRDADTSYTSPNACSTYDATVVGITTGEGDSYRQVSSQFAKSKQVYYRITTKVDGPRNTTSIIQTTVSIQGG
jgi:type IV pilus assembly protein PilX